MFDWLKRLLEAEPPPRRRAPSPAAQPPPPPRRDHRREAPTPPPQSPLAQREAANEIQRQTQPLKARGDGYELLIGRQFEQQGDLVIYNGFIRGYRDGGVDLLVISRRQRSLHLVQCKHWLRYAVTVERVAEIYDKLNRYQPDFADLSSAEINYYLAIPRPETEIQQWLAESRGYTIRKSLYIASDRVVDLALGEHLTMVGENIFRYRDMKLVVQGFS